MYAYKIKYGPLIRTYFISAFRLSMVLLTQVLRNSRGKKLPDFIDSLRIYVKGGPGKNLAFRASLLGEGVQGEN